MKTLYLDIFSGLSGDMFIGAMLDLGVSFSAVEAELLKLGVSGYHLHVARGTKQQISGTKFDVHLENEHSHSHSHSHSDLGHHHGHSHGKINQILNPLGHSHGPAHSHEEHAHGRSFSEIRMLINASALSPFVRGKAVRIFERIAQAEGKIHGQPPEQVHFHEVGAVDSIVDIVGACICMELLGKPRVEASAVIEGTGWVNCAHGRFPIPAPATLEILGAAGIAVTQCEEPHELVTPTGAAILAEFVERFGPLSNFVPEKIGFGLGTRDNKTRPNLVRAVLGMIKTSSTATLDWETDNVTLIETNLDDLPAEMLGSFMETSMEAGALDVFYTPIQMKKNRPGVLLSLLCESSEADRFSELILKETSTFGVRRTIYERRKLRRESRLVKTRYGEVEIKLGTLDGKVIQASPEFRSCQQVAQQSGLPFKQVYQAAVEAAAPLLHHNET
ncbi:MAG: nickel pincer cofactor biosynthesis protein LarC [Verrucomicrobiota bacterium]|nr:nickel pincer cofactor biosynthesis protein LarC [Verrucomicrobiota bacterium]